MSETGLTEFHQWESKGIAPTNPSPYFTRLCDGKAWWEWTVNFIAETQFTNEWQGWAVIEGDYKHDPSGLAQIRRRCHI